MAAAPRISSGLTLRMPAMVLTMTGNTPWLKPKAILLAGPSPNTSTNSGSRIACGMP